jgi:hypothetical protein
VIDGQGEPAARSHTPSWAARHGSRHRGGRCSARRGPHSIDQGRRAPCVADFAATSEDAGVLRRAASDVPHVPAPEMGLSQAKTRPLTTSGTKPSLPSKNLANRCVSW